MATPAAHPSHDPGTDGLTRRDLLKGALLVGSAAALSGAAAACGGGSASPSPSTPTESVPKKGGSLKAAIIGGSAKDKFSPFSSPYPAQECHSFQLYNRLLEYTPDLKLVNVLAESCEGSPDAKTWTVKLRKDVLFSDGRPVTADDVVASFTSILDPKSPGGGASLLAGLSPKGIKKMDKHTVQFRLEVPNAVFPEALAYRENNVVPSDFTISDPIGTGPFALKSYTPGEQSVLTPNPNYNLGEGPYVDELTLVQFIDTQAKYNALVSGAVDMADAIPQTYISSLKAQSGYDTWETDSGSWMPFTMRIDQKPFDDVRVRQAFRLIVDRQAMIDQAMSGLGALGNDMYGRYDAAYPSDVPQRVQDLPQAKALLKAAGYDNNLTVQLVTSTAVGSGGVEAAQVFAEQAKGAGVNVLVKKTDPGIFYGEDYLKWTFAQDLWATRGYLIQAANGTMPSAPYNETHWRHKKWLALVTEAYRTVDEVKRNELIREASLIEHDEGGLIIWQFHRLADGYNKSKLAGLVHDAFDISAMGWRYSQVYFV